MEPIWDEQAAGPKHVLDIAPVLPTNPVGKQLPLVVDPAVESRRCLALRSLRHKFFDGLCKGFDVPVAAFEQWQFEQLLKQSELADGIESVAKAVEPIDPLIPLRISSFDKLVEAAKKAGMPAEKAEAAAQALARATQQAARSVGRTPPALPTEVVAPGSAGPSLRAWYSESRRSAGAPAATCASAADYGVSLAADASSVGLIKRPFPAPASSSPGTSPSVAEEANAWEIAAANASMPAGSSLSITSSSSSSASSSASARAGRTGGPAAHVDGSVLSRAASKAGIRVMIEESEHEPEQVLRCSPKAGGTTLSSHSFAGSDGLAGPEVPPAVWKQWDAAVKAQGTTKDGSAGGRSRSSSAAGELGGTKGKGKGEGKGEDGKKERALRPPQLLVSRGKAGKSVLKLRLNPTHYQKLRVLYSRGPGASQPELFLPRLFAMLARYEALSGGGGGFQAAAHGEVFDVLRSRAGACVECFASPLNCRWAPFCSAFPDTDVWFGSLGSFFDLDLERLPPGRGLSLEANPPFVEGVMRAMSEKMEGCLRGARVPLGFCIIIPRWDDSPGWGALQASKFLRQSIVLKQSQHGYTEGSQQWRRQRYRVSTCDTSVFFLQNALARDKWNLGGTGAAGSVAGAPGGTLQAAIERAFAPRHETIKQKKERKALERHWAALERAKEREDSQKEESAGGTIGGKRGAPGPAEGAPGGKRSRRESDQGSAGASDGSSQDMKSKKGKKSRKQGHRKAAVALGSGNWQAMLKLGSGKSSSKSKAGRKSHKPKRK